MIEKKKIIGVFPGTFDPITFGHLDIIKRAMKITDKLVIAVSGNSKKNILFSQVFGSDFLFHFFIFTRFVFECLLSCLSL